MRVLPLLALAALVLASCGGREADAPSPSAAPAQTAPGGGTEIAGTDLDGETVSLADFRGKPVFVNVWSSW